LANHRRREQRQLLAIARLGSGATETIDAGESDWELATVLASLAPAQLDLLLLHAWAELSYEQIAESLGIPIGTVRSRLARTRATLRARLDAGAPTDISTTQEGS
jgi:RNA polymerase sigma-70 factor (ECF subfamily)